ncbi:MAG: radical SAM protein [Acidobacteria bacterium]|nr:radical SAM protein [Acidobacteriota bacterium]
MNLYLDDLFKKAYDKRQLLYAFFELTYNCNFACKFCYNPVFRSGQDKDRKKSSANEHPLTVSEYSEIFEKLKKGGVLFLTLSGGEPLMHPHFFEILNEAKRRAFCTRIFTNGSLIDEECAKKLKENGVLCVEISIYGSDEKSYEETTGRGEDFEKVVNAVKFLQKEKLIVYLKCILTKVTEKKMDEIQELSDRLGVILRWDPVISPSEEGFDYPLKYRASEDGLRKLLTESKFKVGTSPFERGEGESLCTIGRVQATIDPYGNIHPCPQWKEILGNIRKDDIFEVWKNSERLKGIVEISDKVQEELKKATTAYNFCFHCVARSRLLFNDPLKPDPCELKIAELKMGAAEKGTK